MNPSSFSRTSRWLGGTVLPGGGGVRPRATTVGSLLFAVMAALPLAAQEPDSLVQKELDYRAAVSAYEAAVDAREAVRAQSSSLLEQVEIARRRDADAYQAAQERFWSHLPQVQLYDRRVTDARESLDRARRAFLMALDDRRARLEEESLSARPAERTRLMAQVRDLQIQYDEVDRGREEFQATPAFSPVEYDPRDDPVMLQAKAGLLERRALEAQTQIDEITEEIERLQGRLRLERQRQDFQATRDRFDANRVPVGTPSRSRSETDDPLRSEAARLADLPIPQRIEAMKEIRTQLQTYRDYWLERAQEFRGRIVGNQR